MPKECITLFVGQAGCSVGQRVWELFCHEHDITPDGRDGDGKAPEDDTYLSFFNPTATKYVPRAIFIDTDPRSKNMILGGQYRDLFAKDNVMGWKEDSKNNFFYGLQQAKQNGYTEEVLDRVRVLFDACETPQGFFVCNSYGGGTGTGLGYDVMQAISDNFPKTQVFQPIIYPSRKFSNCIVEPYNCIFAMHYMKDLINLGMVLDNEKAYKVVIDSLGVPNPDFKDLNRVIAQVLSSSTTSLRFESELNASLPEIDSNLRPFPQYKYPLLSYTPLRSEATASHEAFHTGDLVKNLFDEKNLLADVQDILHNRYLAAVVLLRGTIDAEPGEDDASSSKPGEISRTGSGLKKEKRKVPIPLNEAMNALRELIQPKGTHSKTVRFHPCFTQGGFKVGIVKNPPGIPPGYKYMKKTPRAGAMLGNTTAVRQLFVRQYVKFLKLFFHKAYVWQYLEADGEIDAFYEAKEGVRNTIDGYEQLLDECCQLENEVGGGTTWRVEGKAQRSTA
jgi:tubulin alpha